MAAEPEKKAPRLNVRFLYRFCNDLKTMRAFYSDGVGLQEFGFHEDENFAYLGYQSEGLQFMIFRGNAPMPVAEGFAGQPGDGGGESLRGSCSIEVPEDDFPGLFERLSKLGSTAMTPRPTWRQSSYWGWTVNDPMGETIEFYYSPAVKPAAEEPVWPD